MSRVRHALCIFALCSSSIVNFSCVVSSCRSRPTPCSIHVVQGLDVENLHLHIQVEPGVPSSGGSSFRALRVASPRSRHRSLLLELRRLPFPTPHILQCVVLETKLLSALVSPRVPPWMESLVVHCSSTLARSIPLVVAVFSVLHFFLMLTRTINHGVPRSARNT